MGLSSSSAAGGPAAPRAYPGLGPNGDDLRAQLQEALRFAAESRAQADAAQATARAVLERFESATPSEPAPMRGQAAVARLETETRALTPGGGSAVDRSRSARAMQQTGRVKPKLTARAKTPSAVPVKPWSPTVPKPPPGIAPPSTPKAQLPPGKARQSPIGAPPPSATALEEEYELVEDESPSISPKADLRPARPQQTPLYRSTSSQRPGPRARR